MKTIGHASFDDSSGFFNGFTNLVITSPHQLSVTEVDFVVFWGGADIYTGLYDQIAVHTNANQLTRRDMVEHKIFLACLAKGIPMLGICRGSQFLCVMSGGELYQDVGNQHCMTHEITTVTGETMSATSTHHQMMSPQKVKHDLIAFSHNRCSKYFKEKEVAPPAVDYEIVYFPHTNALCIQGHPEYLTKGDRFYDYSHELIKEYMK